MADHRTAVAARAPGRRASGRPASARRHLLRAAHRGIPWDDLPARYGPHTTAYNRFNRWARQGTRSWRDVGRRAWR